MRTPRSDGMVGITDLFQKYRERLVAPERTVITTFCEVVHDLYGIEIPVAVVMYTPRSRSITLRASGVLKQEIALHQSEILSHLQGRLGRQAPTKIL